MSALPDFTGPGFFGGESPDGLTTTAGVPVAARVDVLWRDPVSDDEVQVASTTSAADGTWRIEGLNPGLTYVVRGRKAGFADAAVMAARPARADVVTYENQLTLNEAQDGLDGYVLLDSGLPPFTYALLSVPPSGLVHRLEGRKLFVDGLVQVAGEWEWFVQVESSTGISATVPISLVADPAISDPLWSSVIVMLVCEAAPLDVKSGIAFEAVGTPVFGVGVSGTAMQLTAGNSGVRTTLAGLPELSFGSQDFVVECFVTPQTVQAGQYAAIVSLFNSGAGSRAGWQVGINSGRFYLYEWTGSTSRYPIQDTVSILDGGEHHIVLARRGGVLGLWVDGRAVGVASTSLSYSSSALRLSVGYQDAGDARYSFRGLIDSLRIGVGNSRYTPGLAFTPPALPLPLQ